MSDHAGMVETVESLYAKWRPILALDAWDVERKYKDGVFLDGGKSSGDAVAVTRVSWEYRDATITFNTRKLAEAKSVEYVVLHEAMHILLNGMRPVRTDHGDAGVYHQYDRIFEEHTCTTLARAFMRAGAAPSSEERAGK